MNSSDPTEEDTDGDGILDKDEKPGQHWQMEAEEPEVVEIGGWKEGRGKLGLDIYVVAEAYVKDNAGVEKIKIKLEGYGWKDKHFDKGETDVNVKVDWDVDNWRIDEWAGSGYDLKIEAHDYAQNGAEGEAHVDSVAEDFVEAVIGAMERIGKEIGDFAIEQMVKSKIAEMFRGVLRSITRGLEKWMIGVRRSLFEFLEELAKWNTIDGDESVNETIKKGTAFMASLVEAQDRADKLTQTLERIMRFSRPFREYFGPLGVLGPILKTMGEEVPEVGAAFLRIKEATGSTLGHLFGLIISDENSLSSLLGINNKPIPEHDLTLPTIDGIINFLEEQDIFSTGPILFGFLESIDRQINTTDFLNFAGIFTAVFIAAFATWGAWLFGKPNPAALGIYYGLEGISVVSIFFVNYMGGLYSFLMQSIFFVFTGTSLILMHPHLVSLSEAPEILLVIYGAAWIQLILGAIAFRKSGVA
ncbi:MAG: hypothetical protein V5A88_04895, partial [Candidatus Thermoplasmatota archaeon]